MEAKKPISNQQTLKFFEDFIRKNETQDFILKSRKIFGIPSVGIPFEKEDKQVIEDPRMFGGFRYIPERLFKVIGKSREEIGYKPYDACENFVKKQKIHSRTIVCMLRLYLIFNQTISTEIFFDEPENDLMWMQHLPSELSAFTKDSKEELLYLYEYMESIAKKYPIVLYINPHASRRQISDFISTNWSYIQEHKTDKQPNFNKVRTKKNLAVNDFIYEHRHLPLKEIGSLGIIKFGNSFPDQGNIGKILSLERKNRK